MAGEQQLIPVVGAHVQEFAVDEDLSMNGSNGSPLRVEYEGDRLGPCEEAPNRTFYIYAPVLHWHVSPTPDESARRAIEQLADEAFRFGQQTEHHEQLLLEGQQAVEAHVTEFQATQEQAVSQLRNQLQQKERDIDGLRDELKLLRVQHAGDLKLVQIEMETKFQQAISKSQTAERKVEALREEIQQLRVDMVTAVQKQTELALVPLRTTLQQLEQEVKAMQTTQTDAELSIQELNAALGTVEKRVQGALEARLVQLENAKDKLMGVVEGITADREMTDEEGTSSPLSPTVPLFGFPPMQSEGSVQAAIPSAPEIADSVTSRRLTAEEKGKGAEEGVKEDTKVQGTTAARVRTEVPTYTQHTGPPLSTFMATAGGATSGATSAPLAAAGEIKVDPPARYSGARVPGVRMWLRQVERWMSLRNFPQEKYVAVVANQTEGAAQAWINQVLQDIETGKRNPFADWEDFKAAMCAAFEPVTATEESRRQLRNLRQTGRVRAYVQRFRELQYRLPGMTNEEAFSTFLAGLSPHIQEQVGAHVQGDLSAAITMAERLDLFRASAREGAGTSGSSGAQYKGPKGGSGKKKGTVHSVEEKKESTPEVAFVKEKGKQKQGKGNAGKKKGKGSVRCYNCGGNHFLRNCKEWQEARKKLRDSGKE